MPTFPDREECPARQFGGCPALSSVFQADLNGELPKHSSRPYQADEVIYNVGDRADTIYYVRSGLVKTSALSEHGQEIILNVHKQGEIFGEACLCDAERSDMGVAMEPTEVVAIKVDNLIKRLQQSQDAMLSFLVTFCQKLGRAQQAVCEFSFHSVSERLVRVLLRLAAEMGRETEEGTELAHYITQEELAQMIAARREVVSAALGRLRERGLINYSRKGKLRINPEALALLEAAAETKAGLR